MSPVRPLLVAFDGSEHAERALRAAAELLPGREAVVLTVWEPLLVAMAHHPFTALAPLPWSSVDEDERSAGAAALVADRGAELARSLGLDARAAARADDQEIDEAIIELADELDADVIVTGTRGLRGFGAHRGSVSEHVLKRAERPVLVVPGPGA